MGLQDFGVREVVSFQLGEMRDDGGVCQGLKSVKGYVFKLHKRDHSMIFGVRVSVAGVS